MSVSLGGLGDFRGGVNLPTAQNTVDLRVAEVAFSSSDDESDHLPPFVLGTREPTPERPLSLTGELLSDDQPFAKELNALALTRKVPDVTWYENRAFVQAARQFMGDENLRKCDVWWCLALSVCDVQDLDALSEEEEENRVQIMMEWYGQRRTMNLKAPFPSLSGRAEPSNYAYAKELNALALTGKVPDDTWYQKADFVERAIEVVGIVRLRSFGPQWNKPILQWRFDTMLGEGAEGRDFPSTPSQLTTKALRYKPTPKTWRKVPLVLTGSALLSCAIYLSRNQQTMSELLTLGATVLDRIRYSFSALMQDVSLFRQTFLEGIRGFVDVRVGSQEGRIKK